MTKHPLFLLLLGICAVHGHVIYYNFHEDIGVDMNACVLAAMEKVSQDTCLTFVQNSKSEDSIFFIESSRCGWQVANSTVHLNSVCIKKENCTQILHRALTAHHHHPSVVNRHINLKYNCTDKCTILCENGGIVTPQCTCKCQYGFAGTNCEKLKHNDHYTDPSCGLIDASTEHSQGIISLRSPAEKGTFCQWVLKATDPWTTFELVFEDLDLDNENLPMGQNCGDQLNVYGLKNFTNPVACDSSEISLVGKSFQSESNIIFIEYRGNYLSSQFHKGPTIRYKASGSPYSNDNRSFQPLSFSGAQSTYKNYFAFWSVLGMFLVFAAL